MLHHFYHKLVSFVTFGLIIFVLASCGGGGAASPTTGSTVTVKPTSSPKSYTSIVNLTVSGAMNGTYKISDTSFDSYTHLKGLSIYLISSPWDFYINFYPYTGPGSYKLNTLFSKSNGRGDITFANTQHTETWVTARGVTCPMTIASDTPTSVLSLGQRVDELKGTFSCAKLDADPSTPATTPPISISNGQFDVFVSQQ